MAGWVREGDRRSFLRHPGLAQAGEIGGFMQGTDVRHAEILDGPQPGDTRKTIVADQPSGFGEFGGGAFGLACEGVGGGEISRNDP